MDPIARIEEWPKPARWPIQFLIGLVGFVAGGAVVFGIMLGLIVLLMVARDLLTG